MMGVLEMGWSESSASESSSSSGASCGLCCCSCSGSCSVSWPSVAVLVWEGMGIGSLASFRRRGDSCAMRAIEILFGMLSKAVGQILCQRWHA